MASISSERLREMEAEMYRFEAEISSKPPPPPPPPPPPGSEDEFKPTRVIIGSKTFHEVQEKLSGTDIGVLLSPPPPPPPLAPQSNYGTLAPPPPPPSFNRPSFIPPQIRHRQPPVQQYGPPMHAPMGPMGHPGYMGGYPPSMPRYGPPGPPRFSGRLPFPPHGQRPPMIPSQHPRFAAYSEDEEKRDDNKGGSVIEAKSVIYKPPTNAVDAVKEQLEATMSEAAALKETVAPGIEVNVPAQEIQPQKFTMPDGSQIVVPNIDVEAFVEQYKSDKAKKDKKKKNLRAAANTVWEDPSLDDWAPDDFRVFCGDLGNEVTDEVLARAFSRYPSFTKARVVRDKRTNKTRGYGFVSFKDPNDFVRAIREMNGKYVGNRPIKLRKSCWRDRQLDVVRKKEKEKKKLGLR